MIAIDRYLLPEGDHRILAWFREHLHVPHGWRERMARPGPLRSASPTPSESAMIDAAREAYGRMRFIAQKDYPHGERERLVLFFFEEDGDRPVTVVKLRREGSGGRSLEQEWQALRFLAGLPQDVSGVVPRPLDFRRIGDAEALLVSALPGRSPYVAIWQEWRPRRLAPAHFVPAALWLARFHNATRRASASAREIPPSASHGDYWARNLLLEGSTVTGVVDWEHFDAKATPLGDLFFYPRSYGENFPWSRGRRAPQEDAFRRTFLEENAIAREVRRWFDAYCEETGLPRDQIRPQFLYHLESEGRLAEHRMLLDAGRSALDPP